MRDGTRRPSIFLQKNVEKPVFIWLKHFTNIDMSDKM